MFKIPVYGKNAVKSYHLISAFRARTIALVLLLCSKKRTANKEYKTFNKKNNSEKVVNSLALGMLIRFYQSIRRREQRTSRAWQTFNPTNESLGHTIALIEYSNYIQRNVFYVRYRMRSSVGSCIQNNRSW